MITNERERERARERQSEKERERETEEREERGGEEMRGEIEREGPLCETSLLVWSAQGAARLGTRFAANDLRNNAWMQRV